MSVQSKLHELNVGDLVVINDGTKMFTVCGISENFVILHNKERKVYTIISKQPTTSMYNGIPAGEIVCAGDDYIFGHPDGYHFDDEEWVKSYLGELESGKTKMSRYKDVVRRVEIVWD